MKIRTGFVSNSSSSSFVAVLSKDTYVDLVSSLSPIARIMVGVRWSNIKHKKLDNMEVVLYSSMSGEQDDNPIDSYCPNRCIEFAKELIAVTTDQETAEQLRGIIETISESAEDDGSGLARRLQRQIQKRQKQQDEYEAMGVLRGMYYEGRHELEKALAELELDGKSVVVVLEF